MRPIREASCKYGTSSSDESSSWTFSSTVFFRSFSLIWLNSWDCFIVPYQASRFWILQKKKGGIAISYLPNLLSVARIVFAGLLLINQQPLFSICYLMCGLTDVLDGFIARKYHLQTTLGSKLDSLGDFVFFVIVLFLYFKTRSYPAWIIYGIVIVASIRFFHLILTKVKFAQWGMLHTLSNKMTGFALFFLCFAVFTFGDVPEYVWVVTFLLALFSSIEETIIVWCSSSYEPDPKGFFTVSHRSS